MLLRSVGAKHTNMKPHIFFGLLSLMLGHQCLAQTGNSQRIGAAYFGEIATHPGFSLSYEKDFYSFRSPVEDDLLLPKSRTLFYSIELGGYHHKRAMNAAFAQLRVGFRKRGRKGGAWSVDMGNGYFMGSIPNTFSLENGSVEKTSSLHHYTMHSLNVSYGRKFKWLDNTEWFASPSFYITRPAFPNYTAHAALRIGIKKQLA